jgi:hypothetical protein
MGRLGHDPETWVPVFAVLTYGSEKIMVKQEDSRPFRSPKRQ